MDPELFTPVGEAAASRHALMLGSMTMALERAVRGDPNDARVRTELAQGLANIAAAYSSNEAISVIRETDHAYTEASRLAYQHSGSGERPSPGEAAQEYRLRIQEHLLSELATQLARESGQALAAFDRFMLSVRTAATAQRTSVYSAHLVALKQSREPVSFLFIDRAGRSSAADRFVRVLWRHSLLTLANEAYLLAAAQAGATGVRIVLPKPPNDGLELGFGGVDARRTYGDIRDEIFHPNTIARLEAFQ
jgi:hypothetical protein